MQQRRLGGINIPLVLLVGALIFYLFFIPADFKFNFFASKTTNLPSPPPYIPQNTVKQCPTCEAPIKCPAPVPAPVPAPDAGEDVFCLGAVSRCNRVGIDDANVCRLLSDVLKSNYTGDVCSNGSSIPHTIHQSWKHAGLPENFATWSQSWKDTHPDWEYKFWSDEDNNNFVAKEFGWLKDTYSKLPAVINQADMVRYLYMFKEGGVYADMDTWLMRKLDTLAEGFSECVGQKAIVAMLSDDMSFHHNIPNAWMASSPGHPFWLFLVRVIQERYMTILMKEAQGDKNADVGVESLTGPIVLKEAYDTWQCTFGDDTGRVQALESGYVFISNWNDEKQANHYRKMCDASQITTERQQKQCLKAFPNAHVLTFWTHSWVDPWFARHENDGKQTAPAPAAAAEEEGGEKKDKDYAYEDEGDYH